MAVRKRSIYLTRRFLSRCNFSRRLHHWNTDDRVLRDAHQRARLGSGSNRLYAQAMSQAAIVAHLVHQAAGLSSRPGANWPIL